MLISENEIIEEVEIEEREENIEEDIEEEELEEAELDDEEYSEDDFEVEDIATVENVEADERIIPKTYEEMEALYKPASGAIGATGSSKNVTSMEKEVGMKDRQFDKTDEEHKIKPDFKSSRQTLPESKSSGIPDPEYVSDKEEEEDDEDYSDEEYEGEYSEDDDEADDSDLMQRLEIKYGKLPQKLSDNEPDDDDDSKWTSNLRSQPKCL